jgi:phage terminase Nu1 subunit (DNA packaging protein)
MAEYISGQQQLARAHGVSDVTVQAWEAEGMPVMERGGQGRPNRYRLADTIEWRVDREVKRVSVETPRDRLYRLQAEQAAMNIAKERGVLVLADEFERALQARIVSTREHLLRDRTWSEHDAEPDAARRRELRRAVVDTALRGVASAKAAPIEGEDDEADA